MDCGRRPHLPNICAQSHPPLQKTRFRQISLRPNSAAAVRAIAKKFNYPIANRKSTISFQSSHRWNLCITPESPKGWLKTRIFTFGVDFQFFVAVYRRHFKLVCILIIASPSLRTANYPWKGRGHCHVTSLNFGK